MNRTILYNVQRDRGAHFTDVAGWEIPVDFGDCLIEHKAVRESMGLLERWSRGFLVVTGRDRYSWLQGMISNDVRPLEAGTPAACACILDSTGHLLADVTVVNRGDCLLLDLARENVEKVYRLLDTYIISEDVELVDQTSFLHALSIQGPKAEEGWVRGAVGDLGHIAAQDHTGDGGYDIYLKATDAPALWEKLVDCGVQPVGESAADTLRIEAGIPEYGRDMDETTIPLECNLGATHISETKGCYVGQEIVARIQSRGHTNRALTGLLIEGAALPIRGDKVFPTEGETDREVGWVTSATHSPSLERSIAMGYIRHEIREPGTHLRIFRPEQEDVITARVTELPFYKRAGKG